jgi:hypothetical protein
MSTKNVWQTLSAIDVNGKVEKKGKLSYLSWAWAWGILKEHYPASTFSFRPSVVLDDGTVEVWVDLTVTTENGSQTHEMWLPVMDNVNKAVKNPDSRKISDARMRCLTKCIAMFGLGHYIYAGEDLPEQPAEKTYSEWVLENKKSIDAIKAALLREDLSTAAEEWFTLTDEIKEALWKAPTKGGCFSTKERDTMKTSEFRQAYYGPDQQEQANG